MVRDITTPEERIFARIFFPSIETYLEWKDERERLCQLSLVEVGFSQYQAGKLATIGVNTLEDLLKTTREQRAGISGFGSFHLRKIENLVSKLGFSFKEDLRDMIDKLGVRSRIRQVWERLSDQEREIMTFRYGLESGHPCTIRETAEHFGLPREEVRRIEIRVMEKLKHPSRKEELQAFRELLRSED